MMRTLRTRAPVLLDRLQPSEARALTVLELDAFHTVLEREHAAAKRRR